MSEFARKLWPAAPLAMVIAGFAAVVALVNPLWETAFSDDWAFAQMSRHVIQTGQYVQNPWLAPNSPLHVYWGALFAKIGGFSFGSLRLSTLSLLFAALVCFYFLARESDFTKENSAALTLIVLSSPLVLLLGFTFMSDIPFFAYLTAGLLFFTSGIRRESYWLMACGSIAAGASILIRQLGGIFVPALIMTWLISPDRKRLAPLYITGMVIPSLAVVWQIAQPQSWALQWLTLSQETYFRTLQTSLPQAVWRVMVVLQYVAFSIPAITVLVFLEAAALIRRARRSKSRAGELNIHLWLIIVFMLFILGMSLAGTFLMGERGILPFVPWSLNGFIDMPTIIPALITLFTTLGAVLLGRIICLRYLASPSRPTLSPHEYVLDFVTAGLFVVTLIDIQLWDRYFIPLIPYAVIIAARFVLPGLERLRWQVVSISLGVLLVSCLWVRATLSERTAVWEAGEVLVAQGVSPDQISSSLEWNSYHGAFDRYLADSQQNQTSASPLGYMDQWLGGIQQNAEYLIISAPAPPEDPGFEIVQTKLYHDMLFRERPIYVLRRKAMSLY